MEKHSAFFGQPDMYSNVSSSEASLPKISPLNILADQSEQRIQNSQYGSKYSFRGTFAESRDHTFGHGMSKERINNKISVLQSFSEMHGLSCHEYLEEIAEEEDDCRFIEEVVSGLVKDQHDQESIHDAVDKVLKAKASLSSEDKESILLEVGTQQENYSKVLTYIGYLLDNIKKTKNNLRSEVYQRNMLEEKHIH